MRGRPGRLQRAPPCSEARVFHTCSILLLGAGAASAVSVSSGRGEKAVSKLFAVWISSDLHTVDGEMASGPCAAKLPFVSARGGRVVLGRGV
jgi:hypothetical protein